MEQWKDEGRKLMTDIEKQTQWDDMIRKMCSSCISDYKPELKYRVRSIEV